MSVSRLSKFQAFISRHQTAFEIYEVNSYLITFFYTFMESHDDYASFHGSVAQFQHVLAKICVIEICLSSKDSFQGNNLILQCLRWVLIKLPCSTHCWKDILIFLLLLVVLPNSSLYWRIYVHLKATQVPNINFKTSNLFLRLWINCLSDCPLLGIFEELFWMRFYGWLYCSFQVCVDKDVCVWMLPKFQTLISRQQTCFALCEVNSNPMTLVWIFF